MKNIKFKYGSAIGMRTSCPFNHSISGGFIGENGVAIYTILIGYEWVSFLTTGEVVSFEKDFCYEVHPLEVTGTAYSHGIYRKTGQKISDLQKEVFPPSAIEFLGEDPKIEIPTETYFVFGSGSHSVRINGELPVRPIEDFGHNGFWGERGIRVQLSEIPFSTSVMVSSNPGGDHYIIKESMSS